MNSRCQIDLIDMQAQPDGNYKFILVYQDHLTKFVNLRPLSNKRAEEVAYVLLDTYIYIFGAPAILQSDNGREFSNKIVEELCSMWKDLKIVHGKSRHSQSQGSVERANQDIENMLGTWLQDNKTKKWSEGIKFVQFMKNRSFHHGIKSSPYEAMFGSRAKIGLNNCILPMHVVEKLKTEEDLEKALNTIEEEENKEKNKEGNEVIIEENEENYNSEDAYLNCRKLSIQTKRNESVQNLDKQANKMKSLSERRFCEGNIGDSVKIKIPDVDRARSDLRSILAVIISSIINNNILIIICSLICLFIITIFFFFKVEDGNNKLGTTKGKLQHYYSRNQFTICKEKFVSVDEVPDIQLSLREAARLFSNLGGQGYDRCTCVQKCETRRCKCKAAGILCNSKCHNGNTCKNK